MSSSLPEQAIAWYAGKVREYGFDHRGLGFRTRSSQQKRFEALEELGDFEGASILDVGCGFGDLLVYLQGRGVRCRYTGLDACEPMIEHCRERFAQDQGRFVVGDALGFEPGDRYDYVVASGLFGLDAPGAHDRIRPTLEKLFEWSRIGAAANFLSTRSPHPVENRVYVDPCKALEAAFSLTPAARLNHAYLPNDFTLYVYKLPAWQGEDKETRP
jgi:SAM-dependent methyltransferase